MSYIPQHFTFQNGINVVQHLKIYISVLLILIDFLKLIEYINKYTFYCENVYLATLWKYFEHDNSVILYMLSRHFAHGHFPIHCHIKILSI